MVDKTREAAAYMSGVLEVNYENDGLSERSRQRVNRRLAKAGLTNCIIESDF